MKKNEKIKKRHNRDFPHALDIEHKVKWCLMCISIWYIIHEREVKGGKFYVTHKHHIIMSFLRWKESGCVQERHKRDELIIQRCRRRRRSELVKREFYSFYGFLIKSFSTAYNIILLCLCLLFFFFSLSHAIEYYYRQHKQSDKDDEGAFECVAHISDNIFILIYDAHKILV